MKPATHRILLVSALPPPAGGIQTWTQVLCERGLPGPYEFDIVDARVTRRHQDIPPTLNLAEAKRFFAVLRRISAALRSRKYMVMHLNCSLTTTATPRNLLSTLISRATAVPYVLHLRGTFAPPKGADAMSRLYRGAYRTMLRHAGAIIALGGPSYGSILELGDFAHKTVRLLPNFVDFRHVHPRVPSKPGEPMKVIFTGALTEAKGTATVLAVAECLSDVRFQLVGDAPPESRTALIRGIRERRMADRVEVLGPVSSPEVLRLLSACDAFFFPSKQEGFPNSVSEAMATGLPVVASDVGAIPEMVDAGRGGYLAAAEDVPAHTKALIRLRDSHALRQGMGDYNRRKAIREYDYDVVVKELCAIYSKFIGGAGKQRTDNHVRQRD